MDQIEKFKTVGGLVISVGVSAIISNVVRATTPARIGVFTKVCMIVGGLVLANMVSDEAVKYAEQKIDKIVKIIRTTDDVTV